MNTPDHKVWHALGHEPVNRAARDFQEVHLLAGAEILFSFHDYDYLRASIFDVTRAMAL